MANAVSAVTYMEGGGAVAPVLCQGLSNKVLSMGVLSIIGDYTTNGVLLPQDVTDIFSGTGAEGLDDVLLGSKDGYVFEYMASTKKVKVRYPTAIHTHTFSSKPTLIVEEVVTVAANVGTLANVPLYIAVVHVTAGSVTGAFNVIPTGETPLTKQVAVTFTTGVLTFLGTDAVTSVKVTYIPKRTSGYLSTVTVDETKTAAAAKVNLTARAGLIQYIWNDTNGILCSLEPSGEAPTATNTAVIDINDSSNSSVDTHADDDGDTLKVTYIPYTQLPPGTFIDDTDITLSSQVWNFTGDPGVNGYHKTIVPGCGTQLVGEAAAAANALATWEGPSGTAANNIAVWNPAINKITTAQTDAMLTTAISWMVLDVDQLTPYGTNANSTAVVGGEVGAGVTLNITGIPFLAFGI